jgi:two-component system sensor histidine kinase/response regulator
MDALNNAIRLRSDELLRDMRYEIGRRTDHMFAVLMVLQWIFGIFCAFVISPTTWAGTVSSTHIHVWAALFLGGAITALPVFLAIKSPGTIYTRHIIAVAQMLWSALLIHLTGGRIETHFHVFGSLAFLTFYRDWRVLITASLVVAIDHFVRGVFWPQSVFGVLAAGQWRWVEHAAWVIFTDIFLIRGILQRGNEMRETCTRQARLENVNEKIEAQIKLRTAELEAEKATTEKQAALLAKSNEELQQFAYIASHDLQEPLRMVSSYMQLLSKRYKGKLDKDADEFIEFAVDGASRMKQLINDLLEYSRVGTQLKPRVPTDSEMVLLKTLSNLKLAISDANAEVTHDTLPEVSADSIQLERLLQNLIGNAIKYRKTDVRQKIHISAKKLDNNWVFSIQDNGIGIPKDQFNRIFLMFQRLHTAKEIAGTGIGLSICQKIVQNHKGKIWVESEIGKGSTFYFTIAERESDHV